MENFTEEYTCRSLLDDEWSEFIDLVQEDLEVDRDTIDLHIGEVQIDDTAEYPLVNEEFNKIAIAIGVTSDELECTIRMNIDIALMG